MTTSLSATERANRDSLRNNEERPGVTESRHSASAFRWCLRKRVLIPLAVLAVMALVDGLVRYYVARRTQIELLFGDETDVQHYQSRMHQLRQRMAAPAADDAFAAWLPPSPFDEVDAFDDDAKSWTSLFDAYGACGVLVFDANGDGLPDVYFTQAGSNWTRPTDDNGVLLDEPHYQHCGLYLNQGNRHGRPIFAQIKDLATANETFVEQELLVENHLFPRTSLSDSEKREGRQGQFAAAADLNSDGRLDLIVGSGMPGMIWSHPATQRVLGRFVQPVGRKEFKSKVPLKGQGLAFRRGYKPLNHQEEVRDTARGTEPFGANSVFLNMGDRDHDGIPEWKDVTRETGLGGKRNTSAVVVSDFDLDGDLDVFTANSSDEDYWPGGATALSGAANQLYVNQLKETGTLKFVERAAKMDVDGVYDRDNPVPNYYKLFRIPFLPEHYSVALFKFVPFQPDYLTINGSQSEKGQISWTATAQDVNDDGYPDIWVANDLGFLRLYINQQGERFRQPEEYARHDKTGSWMSFSAADFNGDQREDLFAGNMGGATMNIAFSKPHAGQLFEPVMTVCIMAQQFFGDKHRSMHAIIDGSDYRKELANKVRHSAVMPPDAALPNNCRMLLPNGPKAPYDPDSLDPYEFAWGSTTFDVQNDGRPDLYWMGGLYGRGGGIMPIIGSGPGRLLVNATHAPDKPRFVDLTAEYHLFNILELQYDRLESEGYIYRKSPSQNWHKRSTVTSQDLSVWGLQGPDAVQKVSNHDLIQVSENGRAVVAADLNGDGFADVIVRNMGGYDSRSSQAVNLKAVVNGRRVVIPPHDANFPSPTNYEPGSTRLLINAHGQDSSPNHWIKIQLLDDSAGSFNRDAIGAQVIVNNRYLKTKRVGEAFLSNSYGPLLFGLDKATATSVEVRWPDKQRTVTRHKLDHLKNTIITISKRRGVLLSAATSRRI